jgi:S-adenosylmethionine synthetase
VKVTGIRHDDKIRIIVACAMIGRYLSHVDDYLGEKAAIEDLARRQVGEHGFPSSEVAVSQPGG